MLWGKKRREEERKEGALFLPPGGIVLGLLIGERPFGAAETPENFRNLNI